MSEPSSPPAPRLAAVKLGYLILFALMGVAWIIYLAGVGECTALASAPP